MIQSENLSEEEEEEEEEDEKEEEKKVCPTHLPTSLLSEKCIKVVFVA